MNIPSHECLNNLCHKIKGRTGWELTKQNLLDLSTGQTVDCVKFRLSMVESKEHVDCYYICLEEEGEFTYFYTDGY